MKDLEFVQKCINGDKQSWDEFLKRYTLLIYKYIHSVINSKGTIQAKDYIEDIFQELFSALIQDDYKKLKSFRGKNDCSLASWLRQVTINFTIDYLRRIKPALSLDAMTEQGTFFGDFLVDRSFSVSEIIIYEEKLKSLEECIDKLSYQEKYLLELNINQGIRLEAIREHLKISRGAIDMQKTRILDKLRDCFSLKGFKLDF
jgi:RNA polymerase sigma factor (sigma-70 family)